MASIEFAQCAPATGLPGLSSAHNRSGAPAGPSLSDSNDARAAVFPGPLADQGLRPQAQLAASLMSHWADAAGAGLKEPRGQSPDPQTTLAESALSTAAEASGSPLPETLRRQFEQALGTDLSQVRLHTGEASAHASALVGARAYTTGSAIHFGSGQYDPATRQGQLLLAHEVAHTVQQGSGTGCIPQLKSTEGASDHGSETEADAAAEAMIDARAFSIRQSAPRGVVARKAVSTNGGTFDTTRYAAVNRGSGVGKNVGADIGLKFTPNELVEANTIGLIQSVKTQHSSTPKGAVDQINTLPAPSFNAQLSLTAKEGDAGRAIDQGDGASGPNTNPFYAVENPRGQQSATLTDVGASSGFGSHGHRKRKADGTYDVQDATLSDTPNRRIGFLGQQFEQKFEVTALVADGPLANTYLGAVEWGWKADASGNAALDPASLRMVSAGAPSAQFMNAAGKWNNATLTDPVTGKALPTVDIPLTTVDSGTVAASERTTQDLLLRLRHVEQELSKLAAGTDHTNKEFEQRALSTELKKRNAVIELQIQKSGDEPASSTGVYVRLGNQGRHSTTRPQAVGGAKAGLRFVVPLGPLVPIAGKISIEVVSGSQSRPSSPAVLDWEPPYGQTGICVQHDGAGYDINATLER